MARGYVALLRDMSLMQQCGNNKEVRSNNDFALSASSSNRISNGVELRNAASLYPH